MSTGLVKIITSARFSDPPTVHSMDELMNRHMLKIIIMSSTGLQDLNVRGDFYENLGA